MRDDPSFRTVRWIRTLNLLAQAVLLLTLFGSLNYLASHYGWRFDLTEGHRNALSPETVAYLKGLDQPVHIVVTIAEDNDDERLKMARRDIRGLLEDYVYQTSGKPTGRVTVEYLDVLQNKARADQLHIQPNTLLVLAGEHEEHGHGISLSEMYRIENKSNKDFPFKDFHGEQAITAAILEVTNPMQKKILFLKGDGEMSPTDGSAERGLTAVADELKQRSYAVDTLDLTSAHAVSAGTDLLVIAGPQGRLRPATVELLRKYLTEDGGHMLVLLAPGEPHGLDDLLDDWGVLADDDLIISIDENTKKEEGELILHAAEHTTHPVIETLVANILPVVFGSARSVRPDPGRTLDASLVVTPLIEIGETQPGNKPPSTWGEHNYRNPGVPTYNANVDQPPPLTVVTAAERVPTHDTLLDNHHARLVVFGGTDWITNSRESIPGNLNLFLSAVNWTLGREEKFNIPARPVEQLQLTLTQQQLGHLRLSLLLICPAAAALLGLLVTWSRRR